MIISKVCFISMKFVKYLNFNEKDHQKLIKYKKTEEFEEKN